MHPTWKRSERKTPLKKAGGKNYRMRNCRERKEERERERKKRERERERKKERARNWRKEGEHTVVRLRPTKASYESREGTEEEKN